MPQALAMVLHVLKKSLVSHLHMVYSTEPPVALHRAAPSSGSGSLPLGTKNQRPLGVVLANPFCQICQKEFLLRQEGDGCVEYW